jgi:hypothetical protein
MIKEGRARGDYLARTYDIADASIDRACNAALELFADRCWAMGGLMERIIGMDHLGGVVRRFYAGPAATKWRRDFADLRRRVNRDLVEILSEVIDLARRAPALDDPSFRADFDRLAIRERENRTALFAECEALRARLDDVVLPGIGARRDPELRLVAQPSRHGLARHAAAVALAFSVAGATACKKNTPVPPPPTEPSATTDAASASDAAALTPATPAADDASTTSMPQDAAAPADSGALDSGSLDSGSPDAGKPKPKPKPKFRDHPGISEFAAPPLNPRRRG